MIPGLQILFVALGGACGALARFGMVEIFKHYKATNFPYAILICNLVGCFVIGLISAAVQKKLIQIQPWNTLVIVGFLGALTTFSTYAMNNTTYILQKNALKSSLNILLNLIFGIFLSWAGYQLVMKYAGNKNNTSSI